MNMSQIENYNEEQKLYLLYCIRGVVDTVEGKTPPPRSEESLFGMVIYALGMELVSAEITKHIYKYSYFLVTQKSSIVSNLYK